MSAEHELCTAATSSQGKGYFSRDPLQRAVQQISARKLPSTDALCGAGCLGPCESLRSRADLDKILKESDEFVSTMAALLQPYCEDALGKVVDARTPGLVSLSFPPSEARSQLCAKSGACMELQDVEPQPTEDYILASFYSTWRRSQLKMMHFLGPGAAKVKLKPKEDDTAGEEAGHQDSRLLVIGARMWMCRQERDGGADVWMDDCTNNMHAT
eukprot:s508_g15.t1